MYELNIFFPTEELRDCYIKKIFQIESTIDIKEVGTMSIVGIENIKFRNFHEKIPGYWIHIEWMNEVFYEMKEKIEKIIPYYWLKENVFFPNEIINMTKMEELWVQKYNLIEEKSDSQVWDVFLKEGYIHLKSGRFHIAMAVFMCIYIKNPFFLRKDKRYYIFEELAYCYETIGELAKSIKCLKIQANLQPDSIEPYLNMSNFLLINGLSEEAIQVCRQGLLINSDNKYLINNLIVGYMNCYDFKNGLAFLEELIEREHEVSMYWKLLGDIYDQIGKYEVAIICYKRAIDIDSQDLYEIQQEIYYNLGMCYEQLNDIRNGILCYKESLKHDKTDIDALLNLIGIYINKVKEYDQALEYIEKVIELYPQNGYGYYYLGVMYFHMNELDQAIWYLYRARKLLPEHQPIQDVIIEVRKVRRKNTILLNKA